MSHLRATGFVSGSAWLVGHHSDIGGLCLSQLLTLYITPVIYLYLDRVDRRLRRSLEPQLEAMPAEAAKPERQIAAE